MKVNQYFLLFVVFLLGMLFSHLIGGNLIEGNKKNYNCSDDDHMILQTVGPNLNVPMHQNLLKYWV